MTARRKPLTAKDGRLAGTGNGCHCFSSIADGLRLLAVPPSRRSCRNLKLAVTHQESGQCDGPQRGWGNANGLYLAKSKPTVTDEDPVGPLIVVPALG